MLWVSMAQACPNCALNTDCYNYSANLWYPAKCPWLELTKEEIGKCFETRSLLFIGDSRTRELAAEVAELLPTGTHEIKQ